jgi:hypothetical protein
MKNGVFWDVTPCGSWWYWYFFAACVGCLLQLALCLVPPILVTLMKVALSSSEMSVLTRATPFFTLAIASDCSTRVLQSLAIANVFYFVDCFHPEDGGDTFSEMSVPTRTTRRHIQEDGILHSHRHVNLKSHIAFLFIQDTQVILRFSDYSFVH